MPSHAPSLAGRAALAILLTIAFYGLALGLAGGLGFAIWSEMEQGRVHGRLLIGGGITIVVILWSVAPRHAAHSLRSPRPLPSTSPTCATSSRA